jgi:hypothetical protein
MGLVRGIWRDHRLFTVLVAVSVVPRVLATLAFRPALLTADSFIYMQDATQIRLSNIRPPGYSLLLWLIRPFPSPLFVITTLQHLMGIGVAVVVRSCWWSRCSSPSTRREGGNACSPACCWRT